MKAVTVFFANGDHFTTNINGSDAEILEYYKPGKTFNLGTGADGAPEDNLQPVTEVHFLDENGRRRLTQYQHLDNFAYMLLENGYTLIIKPYSPKSAYPWPTWIHFEKNGKIGTCEASKYEEYSFSSVHKPSREAGTGISISREKPEATLALAEEAANYNSPCRIAGPRSALFHPKKWASLEEYLNNQIFKNELITIAPVPSPEK